MAINVFVPGKLLLVTLQDKFRTCDDGKRPRTAMGDEVPGLVTIKVNLRSDVGGQNEVWVSDKAETRWWWYITKVSHFQGKKLVSRIRICFSFNIK